MELEILCFVFIISLSLAAPTYDESGDDFYSNDDYDSKENDQRSPAKVIVKQETRPPPTYEVTENVVDIPSPKPPANFIIANFTNRTPLNIVPAIARNNSAQNDNNVTPNAKNDPINSYNYFDFDKKHLDSSEEIDDDDDDDDGDYGHEGFYEGHNFFPILRAYLYGLKKGIVNGLNSFVGKGSKSANEPYNTNPVLFEMLRKKSYGTKNSKYFGHEFDDC